MKGLLFGLCGMAVLLCVMGLGFSQTPLGDPPMSARGLTVPLMVIGGALLYTAGLHYECFRRCERLEKEIASLHRATEG